MNIEGTTHRGLYVDVKQAVGSSFETGPIEVSKPVGYKGPWDHEVFSGFAQRYYRSLVGATGSGIRIAGAGSVRMRNNTFVQPAAFEFQVKAVGGPW
jgi:hypothetical protein